MNEKHKVAILSWDEAQRNFSNKNLNKEFRALITAIVKKLGKSKNYVYSVELKFGDKVIENGAMNFDKYEIEKNDFGVTPAIFKRDINYSEDPLGIVVKNHLEVYSINDCENRERQITTFLSDKKHIRHEPEYNVPLNVIEEGDLFGVFGTLDFITGIKTSLNTGLDWYVVAGNATFLIDLPIFHSKMGKMKPDLMEIFNEHGHKNEKYYPGKEQIEFVKKYAPNFRTNIVYFPKHFFEIKDVKLKQQLEYALLLKGWQQYSPLRHFIFENKVLGDILRDSNLKNNPQFILQLFEHLKNITNEKAFALYPLNRKTNKHVLLDAIESFKLEYENYYNKNKALEPVAYIYKRNKFATFCILSLTNLPILRNYKFTTLNEVIDDLNTIERKMRKAKHAAYTIGTIEGFGATGNQTENKLNIKELPCFQRMIADHLEIESQKLVPAFGQFSNVIVVKHL
jgi:hypothetical protein